MIFSEIETLDQDRKENAKVLYRVIQAAKIDHARSRLTTKKFSLRSYERRLNEAFPKMDNKTALQTAVRTAKILRGESKGNPSTISGNDLYRAVRFFLVNLSGYEWPEIIDVLKKSGDNYKKLPNIGKDASVAAGIDLNKITNQRVGDLIQPGEQASDALRHITNIVEKLEKETRMQNTKNRILERQAAKMKENIEKATLAADRINKAYDLADKTTQEELKSEINRLHILLKSLNSVF